MKKIIIVALSLLTLLCLAACAKDSAQNVDAEPSPARTEDIASAEPTEEPQQEVKPPTEEQIADMFNAMDSILRVCDENEGKAYDAGDEEYVWDVLYYLCVNNCESYDEMTLDSQSGELHVPAQLAEKLAAVCFSEITDLPELPSDSRKISYDDQSDEYVMMMSDASQMYSMIQKSEPHDDGTARVFVQWVYMDGVVDSVYVFDLVPNESEFKAEYPLSISAVNQA